MPQVEGLVGIGGGILHHGHPRRIRFFEPVVLHAPDLVEKMHVKGIADLKVQKAFDRIEAINCRSMGNTTTVISPVNSFRVGCNSTDSSDTP